MRALVAVFALQRLVWPPSAVAEPVPVASAAIPPRDTLPIIPPSWDLDGTYVWLGPLGAATWTSAPMDRLGAAWDSAFGADLAVVRIRELEPIAAIGGSAGAHRSSRDGGRIWLDAVIGTAIAGHIVGASAGPILELSTTHHPKLGASIRLWGFVGVAPYARFGVFGSTAFMEMGVQLPLPVLRR